MKILFEDNHCLAVYKPSNQPIQPDSSQDKSLVEDVKEYLKTTYQKPGNVYLGVLHRLDRPTSGIVLFAKTSKAAARLARDFMDRDIKKRYLAKVIGSPEAREGHLRHWLRKDKATNCVSVSLTERPETKLAECYYRVRKQLSDGTSLLEVELYTGRPHQIRAQLAAVGHPIVGDLKYGAPTPLPNKSIALCAFQLVFTHPTKKTPIKIILDLDFIPKTIEK